MKKPIVYIDMDGVLADFKSALTKISPELIDEFAGHHDNIPGIFSLMEPVAGAIEAVYAMKDKYDLYILSSSPLENLLRLRNAFLIAQSKFGYLVAQ